MEIGHPLLSSKGAEQCFFRGACDVTHQKCSDL